MHNYPKLHEALSSPIPSILTPFRRDGSIDFDGLENFVERCLENGARTLMLTWGDSLYSLLLDDEIVDVTRFVVERVNKRAAVIAATGTWWTGKAAEFGRLYREIGADILMVLPPDWGHSCMPDTVVAHYSAIGAEIPVMVVTGYLIPRGISPGLEFIRQVYEKAENVVAVKDDFCNEFGRRMTAMVSERWTVISGGQKQNHLQAAPFGCHGHLTTLLAFKPEIAHRYWDAVTAGDYRTASDIVERYDMPLFDVMSRCPGGGELSGIYERWRRPPFYSMNDAEVKSLGEELSRLDLL
jgi:4-hydroxy-tetrahydrodipicolinate synthase